MTALEPGQHDLACPCQPGTTLCCGNRGDEFGCNCQCALIARVVERERVARDRVLADISAERARAETKFPNQHLPNGTSAEMWGGDEIAAKALVDSHHKQGRLTWREVLYEEVCEAFAEEDPALLRAELVQVAAMAVRWIEDIDRALAARPAEGTPGDA